MKNRMFIFLMLMLVAGLISFAFLAGCDTEDTADTDPDDTADVKVKVELLYVDWDCATASTYVVKTVLEDMGYDVTATSLTASLMWNRLAEGKGDALTTAWVPNTQKQYLKETEGKVQEIARNFMDPVKLGLVTPAYTDINSIEDINRYSDEIDNLIIGIDPDSGIMGMAQNAVKEYNLDVDLIEGTDATMTGALKSATDRNEWIVVTGWSPHWKFNTWDLKYLKDPKGVFERDEEEYIATYGRLGLEDDMPEVYNFLKNFQWGAEEIEEVMEMNSAEGTDPAESARTWVDNNQALVQQWIP